MTTSSVSRTSPAPEHRLTVWAGGLIIGIVGLHILVFAFHPYWGDWLTGGLHSHAADESLVIFWALPGGFVVPMALLGGIVIHLGRARRPVPGYTGVALLLWALACVGLIGVSGFITAVAPAILLVLAHLLHRKHSRS